MPSNPKRQHSVPRSLLKNFVDENGKLHCFDRKRDRTYATSPENAFVESHIYTLRMQRGVNSFAAEHALSEIEGRTARVLKQVIVNARTGKTPDLAPGDKDLLDQFVLIQFRRVAERLDALKAHEQQQLMEEVTAKVERELPDKNVRSVMEEIGLDRIFRNSWITSLAYRAPDWLPTKGLAVLYSPAGCDRLLIGSDPVLLAGDDRRKPDGEVILPVASDVAISLAMKRGEERLFVDNRRTKLVRMINSHVFRQSDIVAAASAHILDGLVAAYRKRERKRRPARPE
ncbi:MAG: DUF4238 domain-containing protein [Gammaproteobacteria bacterium]|nr:DUF4238 domain-containing protein [Gammaproteobacteria bacterium]